jgi:hypothetical protein
MDMEHDKYFEIHPVKAWYKICPGLHTEFLPPPPLGPGGKTCDFDAGKLTPTQFADICQLIQQAETLDPDGTKIITVGDGLSSAGSSFGGIR